MTIPPRVFTPFPAQKEFMECMRPELLYSGSFGAGKTLVGLTKGLFLSQYYRGNEGLIVRKVAADLPGTTLKTLFEGDGPGTEVLPPDHILQRHETKHYVVVRTRDGGSSRIWWGGMDRITRLGGTQFGWIFFDECVEGDEDEWVWLEGRLRHPGVPFHQLMGATNPGAPTHFLYDRFIRHGDAKDPETGEPLRLIVHANSVTNPFLPESYRQRLNRFTGAHRDRFVLGKWIGYEGLVYSDFNPGVHIVASFVPPGEWRRMISVDFGGANPHSVSWWCLEPSTDTWLQYRQIYQTGISHSQLVAKVKALTGRERIEDIVCDHDAAGRLEFDNNGFNTTPAKKGPDSVDFGIQKVQNRLRPRPAITSVPAPGLPAGALSFPGGAPGILFMENALVEEDPALLASEEKKPLRTTHEFGTYRYGKGAHGAIKDIPIKKDDHGLDELRYFLLHVDAGDTMAWATTEPGSDPVEDAFKQAVDAGDIQISTLADRIAERKRRREAARRGAED